MKTFVVISNTTKRGLGVTGGKVFARHLQKRLKDEGLETSIGEVPHFGADTNYSFFIKNILLQEMLQEE